jgi:hypothetical protein
MPPRSLMILIAGPYRSGTGDDPQRMAENLRRLESVALPLYRAGHIPLIGEWIALCSAKLDRFAPAMPFTTRFFIRSQIDLSVGATPSCASPALRKEPMKMCGWRESTGSWSSRAWQKYRGASNLERLSTCLSSTVTITGTSGSTVETSTVTLTVN